ncbi:dynein axonemal assembly factor 9 [Patella vulgata]|uniref:dynein axonemal assembly factor 9 n=1 Tax=Patella vulgata TaxID=6465 RepID=UPI0024A869CC|nr:dynein axonemal assembly factor 9 [Patella vulgata]
MSSNKLKRPSSARRHINYETFNQFVSGCRLRRIQSLLNGNNGQADSPDSILSITGIDSRYNEGCQHLTNYLLFDFFTSRKTELERSGFDEEDLDDIILVINSNSVDIYCNVINYHYLLPYTSHWFNVRYHCLTDTEAEDEEMEEDFKMLSFVAMVKDKKCIGIPFFSPGHGGKFDKFAIEKWPIVQAFALDEIGGGGFFTMNYEVCDVSGKVEELYNHVDPVTMEILLTQNVKLLERQWTDMEARFKLELSNKMEKLTEENVAEPLFSYYKHGRIVSPGVDKNKTRCPYVLYGRHASQSEIERVSHELMDRYEDISTSGIKNNLPHHMICQAVSPNSPLVCSRTYFFTPVVNPFKDVKTEDKGDLWYLTNLYKIMIEALIGGICSYTKTLSLKKATSNVFYVIEESLRELDHPTFQNYFNNNRSKFVFNIEGVDNFGKCHKLEEGVYMPLIKTSSISLFDVPSVEHSGKSVGSLVFGESFIDSSFTLKGENQMSSDHVILTSNISRQNLFTVKEADIKSCKQLPEQLATLEKYGDILVTREIIHYTTGSQQYSQIFTGEVMVYENAVILHHVEYGSILLTHTDIQHIQLYDADTNSSVWLLILCLDKLSHGKLPVHLIEDKNQLVLVFLPKTPLHKNLYTQILRKWKTESSFPVVERLEELPQHLISLHSELQKQFVPNSSTKTTNLEKSAYHIDHIQRFINHLSVCTTGCKDVDKNHLPLLLKSQQTIPTTDENEEETDSDEITISIIAGVPGSHKQTLVSTITNYTKEKYRWIVLKQPNDDIREFDANRLHKQLNGALTVHKRRKPGAIRRITKVIVVTNSFTDIGEIINAIETHPDQDVNKYLKIGAVTICIDPLNFYLEHRLILPGILTDCGEGWVNNIILTSCTTGQNDMMKDVQSILRCVNTNVAFIPAERGEVHRSTDLDNILSSKEFYSPLMIHARYLSRPDWRNLKSSSGFQPKMNQILLNFKQPLDKSRFISKLKSMKSSLESHPWYNNIYHVQGQVTFTDSEGSYEVQFVTLSGYMRLQLVETPPIKDHLSSPSSPPPNTSNYLVYTGCHLQEENIKNWLRSCRIQLKKKDLLTRQDLTKDEINEIHKNNHLRQLPSGWFYNGSQFISLTGEKTYQHPNLEDFIEEYVKMKNQEILEHNQKIESEKFVDLFE